MRSRATWWLAYGLCSALVLLALVWVTAMTVRLERAESQARADALYQESLRLALWRMDSWLAPLIANEVARPWTDYETFAPQPLAYSNDLSALAPGEVLTPSPLLSFDSELFRLHFQFAADGRLTSPQAPTGDIGNLVLQTYLSADELQLNRQTLADIEQVLTPMEIGQCAPAPEDAVANVPTSLQAVPPLAEAPPREWSTREAQKRGDYARNIQQAATLQTQSAVPGPPERPVEVGPLVPVWAGPAPPADPTLVFVRRVRNGDDELFQGFLCDWNALQSGLREQVSDLFAESRLRPVMGPDTGVGAGTRLATVPVALIVPAPVAFADGVVTPVRATLGLTWIAVLAGLAAVAVTLRASIEFGDKRSRFASAVTHELRTPLTTFRMYTEMLADGMIRDDDTKQKYLETLKTESSRLSTLVENVLGYARLEDGRRPTHREKLTAQQLGARLSPPLQRRADEAGMTLDFSVDDETLAVFTDAEAVGQIVFNLVDNACKYAVTPDGGTISMRIHQEGGACCIDIADDGPGVSAQDRAEIFKAFERGPHDRSEAPGIGLGLALALGLARDLGGDLVLLPPGESGAAFRLTLPLAIPD